MQNTSLRRSLDVAALLVGLVGCSWAMRLLLALIYRSLPRSGQLELGLLQLASALILAALVAGLAVRQFGIPSFAVRGESPGILAASVLLGLGLPLPLASLVDRLLDTLEPLGLCAGCGRYFMRGAALSPVDISSTLLGGVLASVLVEELFFRHALFERVLRVAGRSQAVLVSSIGFALAHDRAVAVMQALAFGVCLGLLRAGSRGLLPCVLAHAAFNLHIAVLAMSFPIGAVSTLPERAAQLPFRWLAPSTALILLGCLALFRGFARTAQAGRRGVDET